MSKQATIKNKAIPRTTQASSRLKTSPNFYFAPLCLVCCLHGSHGLRTPNEGINQRNLKIWAVVADKICFGCAVKAISLPGVRSP